MFCAFAFIYKAYIRKKELVDGCACRCGSRVQNLPPGYSDTARKKRIIREKSRISRLIHNQNLDNYSVHPTCCQETSRFYIDGVSVDVGVGG